MKQNRQPQHAGWTRLPVLLLVMALAASFGATPTPEVHHPAALLPAQEAALHDAENDNPRIREVGVVTDENAGAPGRAPEPGMKGRQFVANNRSLAEALAGWWPLDEKEGTQITDLSGYGDSLFHNGQTRPGAIGTPDGPKPVQGKIHGALAFEGNTFIEIPHDSTLNIDGGDFTVSAWVKVQAPGENPILSKIRLDRKGGFVVSHGGITLVSDQNRQLVFGCPASRLNTWIHLVLVHKADGPVHECYVGGVLIRRDDKAPLAGGIGANEASLYIGFQQTGGTFFQGVLDEVAFFKKALSPEDIQVLFQWTGQ